jgi:dTDP-L-rhamnose 4-epimerase
MRVLVTGGAGFIGSLVVDALVEGGHDVRVLDLLHSAAHRGRPPYLHPAAEYVWGSVDDPDVVARCLRDVEAVSHQAAMVGLGVDLGDLPAYVRHNDLGTAVLLREMAHRAFNGRFVLASSMAVYGEGRYRCGEHGEVEVLPRLEEDLREGRFDPTCRVCGRSLLAEPVVESSSTDPRNVYAATKLHQEHLGAAFARQTGIPFVALRYHNVYGPRMPRDSPYAGVASIFRSALERGDPVPVYEDGEQLRDFVHGRDVARANVLALTTEPAPRGPFNIASGEPHTIGDMARALTEAFGPGVPAPIITGRYRLGDVRHVFASTRRAQEVLGFRASISFARGMREFASAPLRDPIKRSSG